MMKLACWVDSFDHYIPLSVLCNDQLIKLLSFFLSGFSIFGVFVITSMLKPIL